MTISEAITRIRATIPSRVSLIAVSKTVEEARLREAIAVGQRVFGENYVQEAKAKWPALKTEFPDIQLHLIGHLQSNKADEAVKLFDRIDTLDRASLAEALAKAMRKQNRNIPCLIEVNIGDEPQKAGCAVAGISELLEQCKTLNITILGLMCIPPHEVTAIRSAPYSAGDASALRATSPTVDGATARAETVIDPVPYFKKLVELAKQYGLTTISMGMSSDYEIAINSGATEVRLGSVIFGKRS